MIYMVISDTMSEQSSMRSITCLHENLIIDMVSCTLTAEPITCFIDIYLLNTNLSGSTLRGFVTQVI